MTKEERLRKVLKRIDSAILHVEALKEELGDADLDIIGGHLERAQEMAQSLYYANSHEGKKLQQLQLFEE